MIPFHKQERPRDRGRNKEEKHDPKDPSSARTITGRLRIFMEHIKPGLLIRATAGWARKKSKWDFIITTTGSFILFKVFYLNFLFTILFLAMLDHHIDLLSLDVSHCLEKLLFVTDRIRPG